MLKNYLKVTFRSLKRNGSYTAVNLAGLSVGMTACLLIGLYVEGKVSYDRFHEKAERIYRLTARGSIGDRPRTTAYMPAKMGPALVEDLPGVEAAVRFERGELESDVLLTASGEDGKRTFYEDQFLYADSTFFDVFSFDLLRGNPETALVEPYSVVLTRSVAEKYFGTTDALGESLRYKDEFDLTVRGVVEDPPSNSSVQFDVLASLSTVEAEGRFADTWSGASYPTYLLLSPGTSAMQVERKMPELLASRTSSSLTLDAEYWLTPLTDLHLYGEAHALSEGGDARYVYAFASVALLILLLASANYTSLATARSALRAKEVGVRKVAGATQVRLAGRFLCESVLLSVAALLLAALLTALLLPAFSAFAQIDLAGHSLFDPRFVLAVLCATVLVAVLAGAYPSFVLSSFRPVEALRSQWTTAGRPSLLRKGLVVFQFTASVFLIAGALVVQEQLQYVRSTTLGLEKERVLLISTDETDLTNRQARLLKDELTKEAGIASASVSSSVPTREGTTVGLKVRGEEERIAMAFREIDADFLRTFGIELKEGEASLEVAAGAATGVLINEAAVKKLGWEDPVGKEIFFGRQWHPVVGVVKDFHFESLREEVRPLALELSDAPATGYVSAKIQPGATGPALDRIEAVWQRLAPAYPLRYLFLDRAFGQQYRASERVGRLFALFAFLAVFVACLGLYGLVTFAVERRGKEIAIRKVAGASATSIVALLLKQFFKLIGVACLVAAPVVYLAARHWLGRFAYHADIGVTPFLLAGLAVCLVAAATITYQSIKAAWANPVDALRAQ